MAELLLARTHPLQSRIGQLAAVGITVEPYVPMADVRVTPGTGLPAEPNTWADVDGGRAIWLGPDEWLLTGTTETPEEFALRAHLAVAPLSGSATDVSAQRVTLRLTGDRARDVLAKGCAIDLHPRVFGRGRSAQTLLGQAGVVLLALSDTGDDFLLLVRSSFAAYLAEWLLDASVEFVR